MLIENAINQILIADDLGHYRVVYQKQGDILLITHLDTKTNFKYKKTGCF